jgi:hypothetical protein
MRVSRTNVQHSSNGAPGAPGGAFRDYLPLGRILTLTESLSAGEAERRDIHPGDVGLLKSAHQAVRGIFASSP